MDRTAGLVNRRTTSCEHFNSRRSRNIRDNIDFALPLISRHNQRASSGFGWIGAFCWPTSGRALAIPSSRFDLRCRLSLWWEVQPRFPEPRNTPPNSIEGWLAIPKRRNLHNSKQFRRQPSSLKIVTRCVRCLSICLLFKPQVFSANIMTPAVSELRVPFRLLSEVICSSLAQC